MDHFLEHANFYKNWTNCGLGMDGIHPIIDLKILFDGSFHSCNQQETQSCRILVCDASASQNPTPWRLVQQCLAFKAMSSLHEQ